MEQGNGILAGEKKKGITYFGYVAAIFFYLCFELALMIDIIPSGSMEPTLFVGDVVLAARYNIKQIRRYDIMVFSSPDEPGRHYIKRVIGLPGETVTVRKGCVFVNGVEMDSSFAKERIKGDNDGVYVVPEGCYFMMGDNRNHSRDSRFWEEKYISREMFISKAICIIYPFNRMAPI